MIQMWATRPASEPHALVSARPYARAELPPEAADGAAARNRAVETMAVQDDGVQRAARRASRHPRGPAEEVAAAVACRDLVGVVQIVLGARNVVRVQCHGRPVISSMTLDPPVSRAGPRALAERGPVPVLLPAGEPIVAAGPRCRCARFGCTRTKWCRSSLFPRR